MLHMKQDVYNVCDECLVCKYVKAKTHPLIDISMDFILDLPVNMYVTLLSSRVFLIMVTKCVPLALEVTSLLLLYFSCLTFEACGLHYLTPMAHALCCLTFVVYALRLLTSTSLPLTGLLLSIVAPYYYGLPRVSLTYNRPA
ncbi:hypothetical protein CR513_51048, partial [Mucuna pruriens]